MVGSLKIWLPMKRTAIVLVGCGAMIVPIALYSKTILVMIHYCIFFFVFRRVTNFFAMGLHEYNGRTVYYIFDANMRELNKGILSDKASLSMTDSILDWIVDGQVYKSSCIRFNNRATAQQSLKLRKFRRKKLILLVSGSLKMLFTSSFFIFLNFFQ